MVCQTRVDASKSLLICVGIAVLSKYKQGVCIDLLHTQIQSTSNLVQQNLTTLDYHCETWHPLIVRDGFWLCRTR
jgi:hypothetical protein